MSLILSPVPVGQQFEEEFFGIASQELYHVRFPEVDSLNKKALRVYCNDKFQTGVYGFNTSRPGTLLASCVFALIKEALPERDKDKLRLYCFLGTSADALGADGAFWIRGGRGPAFIDLTTNNTKGNRKGITVLQQYACTPLHRGDTSAIEPFVHRVIQKLTTTP
jgi:hypothetical protein